MKKNTIKKGSALDRSVKAALKRWRKLTPAQKQEYAVLVPPKPKNWRG